MMKILLIAGHGDGDSGACGNGYREADLTREVVKLLQPKLGRICQCDIADTSKNWFEYLGSHSYNFSDYNYVLEVHFNSGGGTGTEIFVTTSEQNTVVENVIVNQMCAATGYRNRGVKRKNFRVINRIKSQGVSAALLEVAFIDSANDMTVWRNKKNEIINAIAKGIADGFGLNLEEEIDMEELKKLREIVEEQANHIAELEKKVGGINDEYDYIDENMPEWYRGDVQWLKDRKILVGDENGELNLSPLQMWFCSVIVRTAKYLGKLMNIKMS